jgi:hypothetical protein
MHLVKGYSRDPVTKIIINKDEANYRDHLFKMELYKNINTLKNEVQFLKNELSEAQASIASLKERNNV